MGALPHIISFNQEAARFALQHDPLSEYLTALQSENKSRQTIKAYQLDLEAFRAWFGNAIAQADSAAILRYLATLNDLTPATRARKQTSLAMFFHWCLLMGIIDKNPMAVIRRTKVPKRLPRPLDDGRLKRFFTSISTGCMRDKLLFTLLIETGLRISEALSLRWEAVDFTNGSEKLIVMGKGQKERTIPLQTAPITLGLLGRLREDKEGNMPIFVGQAGQALSYSQALRLFREYSNAVKLPKTLTLHSLRHTYATNLLEDGVSIAVAQKLLGHADIKTTTLYQGVSDQFVRKELLKRKCRLHERI
jgi:integrase/recombinase XerD